MSTKAQILAKAILQYFQEMNDPFVSNVEDIAGIEEMAREIIKEAEPAPKHQQEKPTPEKYGYFSANCFDSDQSGWQIEGGEEEYYKALAIWESQHAETAPELPDETPLHSSHLRAAGFEMIDGIFYSVKANMVISFLKTFDGFFHTKSGKITVFKTVGDLRKYMAQYA